MILHARAGPRRAACERRGRWNRRGRGRAKILVSSKLKRITIINHCRPSHIQYFDGVEHRDKHDDFYEQLVRVKDIAVLPFADNVQQLLVKYTREDLGQPPAASWYQGHWTGPRGRYNLAHVQYTRSNNNMGSGH